VNTLIPDPETNELNQAYLQYDGHGNVIRLGRQRIAYDNHAFVSNGPWRQNDQTFDSFSITNQAVAGLTLNYAGYGWEYDSVLSKKFDDPWTVIAKLAPAFKPWASRQGSHPSLRLAVRRNCRDRVDGTPHRD
jgi:hypothetical protein